MFADKTPTPIASLANQKYWDLDATQYHRSHAEYLSSFYWCPEMLHEQEAQLLGDLSQHTVLELGCGSAPCSQWLKVRFPHAFVVGFDISSSMLKYAATSLPLVQADATALPFAQETFDCVFSVFGAIPFVEDLTELFGSIYNLLTPGGRFVYSTNHPMRWVFLDDPGEAGLMAVTSYFEKDYVEYSADDTCPDYVEFQHTLADHINALATSGFHIDAFVEPEWPDSLETTWGQWSPLRGKIFPGTMIIQAHRPL
ncbi:class I SAM-dependent methyltransferase [Corynebacterium sp. ES2794-CONJ1]|uniref:class I SAM-dependent DNA methyltransferase n=1 Tax=unclassified Corynebacterium TaxID=2624378 RepID=UPI0021695E8E|nr:MULTISPECIES: class I SAM-dependent methyltransferase [unclassified Corynebacterium]MCS4490736.1 class I SAM-dependent methyltransferase [Corynebacterium sp. ES2775-CONJ]MCS4492538.1 class I SAM-dependent methyltransferase [Corynebacterium sp. ES2715-CONJ3]MCS4532639.1 class I SAM-dependent methyltransferase [Corynebacterium sp. ES2730-CONJ]MCU9520034.1 class I SAM-dependent methyltransferase [Corynebacterium sp. ES2794-CONJ1]